MTREEILAMKPGRELDALVGEYVFEFKRGLTPPDYCGKNGGTDILLPPDLPMDFVYPPRGKIALWYHCKRWSTDLSAAWEVRQWLSENIGGVILMNLCDLKPEYCEIYRGKEKKVIKVQAKAAPEAICKAALLAVMEEEK